MDSIKYEKKEYNFTWTKIGILAVFGPLFALFIYYSNNYVWLHEITAKITVWSLNLISGSHMQVIWNPSEHTEEGLVGAWQILDENNPGSPIDFLTFCTGIQAISMFIGIITFIPSSTIKTKEDNIAIRKLKAIVYCSLLFYLVNILRMWLQLYLYHIGYEWNAVHYPISVASSFIAIAAILLMHKYVPEFILCIIWMLDQARGAIKKNIPPQTSNPTEIKCPNCGYLIEKEKQPSSTCPNCGAKL